MTGGLAVGDRLPVVIKTVFTVTAGCCYDYQLILPDEVQPSFYLTTKQSSCQPSLSMSRAADSGHVTVTLTMDKSYSH